MSKSIIQKEKNECFVCGDKRGLEEHHIFQGINRKNSEHYGLKVYLCHECHQGKEGAHFNNYLRRELHLIGQNAFVKKYGYEEFIHVFGKDYIETGLQEKNLWIKNGKVTTL